MIASLKTYDLGGEKVFLTLSKYANNRTTVQIRMADSGEPYATLTTNLPDQPCPPDEAWIKDHSENQGLADWAVRNDILERSCTTICRSGFVVIGRYKFGPTILAEITKP